MTVRFARENEFHGDSDRKIVNIIWFWFFLHAI